MRSLGRAGIAGWLLCVSGATGCSHVDRHAEIAFLAGRDHEAIEGFRTRRARACADYGLECSLLASAALAAGDRTTARAALEHAAAVMDLGDADLPNAVAELKRRGTPRLYRGLGFERVMNCIYRTLMALERGEAETARSCLRAGLAVDSGPDGGGYLSDVPALYWLDLVLARCAGDRSAEDRDRMALDALGVPAGAIDEARIDAANTIVWIDTGMVPELVRRSRVSRRPQFRCHGAAPGEVRVRFDDTDAASALRAVDITYQATTPGGLSPDGLQPVHLGEETGDGLFSLFEGSLMLFAMFVDSGADLRQWHLLPARSFLWIGHVDEGAHRLTVELFDEQGNPLPHHGQSWQGVAIRETSAARSGAPRTSGATGGQVAEPPPAAAPTGSDPLPERPMPSATVPSVTEGSARAPAPAWNVIYLRAGERRGYLRK